MNTQELKNLSDLYTQCSLYKEHFKDKFKAASAKFYLSSPPGTGINFLINLLLQSQDLSTNTKEFANVNEYIVDSNNVIWNNADNGFQYIEQRPIYNPDNMEQELVAIFDKLESAPDALIYAHVPPYNLVNAGHLKIDNFIHVTMNQQDYIFSKLMVYIKHQMQGVSVGNNNYFLKRAIEVYLNYASENSIEKANISLERLLETLEWTKSTLPSKSGLYKTGTTHFFDTAVHNSFITDKEQRLTCMQSFDLNVKNLYERSEEYKLYNKLNYPLLADVNIEEVSYEKLFFELQVPDCMSAVDRTAIKEYSIKNLELVEELIAYSWDEEVKSKLKSMVDYYYGKLFYAF